MRHLRFLAAWVFGLCVLAVTAFGLAGPVAPGVAPSRVTAPPAAQRVFAKPGDLRLDNADVTAVVRATDGALVDFLRKGPVLPTSDVLGTTTDIDGIWDLVPLLTVDGKALGRDKTMVAALPNAVRVTSAVQGQGVVATLSVDYALDPSRARLSITAVVSSSAPLPLGFEAGFALRAGNTPYFVDRAGGPLSRFEGFAAWAGRRGAGGDLRFRAVSPALAAVRFLANDRAFVPALRMQVPLRAPGQRELRAGFELAYEPLPSPPPPEEKLDAAVSIRVRDERGRALPSKLSIARDGQAQPLFPALGGLDGADRFVWTGNGLIERRLVPGAYDLLLSAGPERDVHRERVVLEPGRTFERDVVLRRALSTPGWISADLHLHQAPSPESDVSLEARLIAVAAEGVQFAAATDHYVVTDFAPTVAQMVKSGALSRPIVTVTGTEVSTVGNRFGHFNVFPIALDRNVEYENTTPSKLFASARTASPDGFLQVNHPRHDPELGYFLAFDLDRQTGVARKPGYDAGYDGLEVFNGFHVQSTDFTDGILLDYLRVLGTGRHYVATGSSDSHQLAFLDPGLPRTWIAYGGADDEADATAPAERVLASLKAGRAVVSSGPLIEARVAGAGPGETAHHVGRRPQLSLRVRAVPWVSTAWLTVLEGPSGNVLARVAIPKSERSVRLERSLPLELTGPTFVVVTVRGDTPLPNTSRTDIVPFAFTNPIWLEP
jgi:hypothetical protein